MINKILLIDGDILLYKYCFSSITKIQWDEETISEDADVEAAHENFNEFIDSLLDRTGAVEYEICLTGDFNFRYEVLPTYKHNRADLPPKPDLWYELREWVEVHHPCWEIKGIEADDIMGIWGSLNPQRYIVATIDKDLQCVPCRLFNWNKDKKPRLISEEDADRYFLTQTLTGDSTDGYKGCPSIGPKRAQKILDEDCSWGAVVATYESKGLTEEDALTQARVARILRHTDWNFTTGTFKLWEP